jgi:hypothetical protein
VEAPGSDLSRAREVLATSEILAWTPDGDLEHVIALIHQDIQPITLGGRDMLHTVDGKFAREEDHVVEDYRRDTAAERVPDEAPRSPGRLEGTREPP